MQGTLHFNFVSGYTGTAGDSFTYHNGKKFITKDNDNDASSMNCAITDSGAWWYGACHYCNPNGIYGDYMEGNGIIWSTWKGFDYTLKYIQFKIRRP